jgi:hypothetical protein
MRTSTLAVRALRSPLPGISTVRAPITIKPLTTQGARDPAAGSGRRVLAEYFHLCLQGAAKGRMGLGRSITWCDLAHLNKSLTERIAPSSVNATLIFTLTR